MCTTLYNLVEPGARRQKGTFATGISKPGGIISASFDIVSDIMTDSDRSLPSWASPEISETYEEAVKSLQTYKKKDSEKGAHYPHWTLSFRI